MTEKITPGQLKQIIRFCEDGLEGFQIGKDVAQRVIERGDMLQTGIRELILKVSATFRIRSVKKQLEVLEKIFPDLDGSHVEKLSRGHLPSRAMGWAVIPKPDKIGTYREALEKTLELVAADRKFENYQEGRLTKKYFRLHKRTMQAHAKLDKQPGGYWVLPIQVGEGRSPLLEEIEFGLGPYEVGILLITHSDLITASNNLCVECVGCKYDDPDSCGHFWYHLCFHWGECANDGLKLSFRQPHLSQLSKAFGFSQW